MNKVTRISIIDDDRSCRMALSSLVRSLGYEPVLFSCAEAFLASTVLDSTDCLITDVHMPGIDGLELQHTLISSGRSIPVIFITAYPRESMRQRALAAGAVCFLGKPYNAQTIIDCIQSVNVYGHQLPHRGDSTMARFTAVSAEEATGDTAQVYADIKRALGKVPNAYAALGTLAPQALTAMLSADKILASGPLSKADQETVKLVISELAGCDYCVAAHSMVGKMAGLSPGTLRQIRQGEATGDAKRDVLVRFVRSLALNPGTLPQEDVQALQSAGYEGEAIVHIGLAISVITFTNVFNRINDTLVDFPVPQ